MGKPVHRTAVIFGAGNIGRGFIGQLFCESGYSVVFVDVDRELVEALNREGSYRLDTVFDDQVTEYRIGPVRALHGSHVGGVAAAVAAAGIGATAVGAAALPLIAPAIARGIELRAAAAAPPLNLIVCENLKGAAQAMRGLLLERIHADSRPYLEARVGLVDTVIGRMVPVPTAEMRRRDVTWIRVEPYKELPVDRRGFRGPLPAVAAMAPQADFAVFTARKLYIHNCGHALLAYTGYLRGFEFGWQALAEPAVRRVVDGGLAESVAGVAQRYGCPAEWLREHVRELLGRFANRSLGDTVFRLGRDPLRKLAPEDRLSGAASLAAAVGPTPRFLAWGIAAGLCFDAAADPAAVRMQEMIRGNGVRETLARVTGIRPDSGLGAAVLEAYALLKQDPRAEMVP